MSNKLRRNERNMSGPSGLSIFFWPIALIDESAGDTKYRHMETRIDLEALCQERGLRITDQRRVIARVISDADDHPDVEELYRRASAIDPKISIATVYRTVRLFEEAGILDRHDFGDGRARYEASPEAHHDHLIDVETGKVIEFVDPELEALQKQIAEKLGYRLVDHRMELYGVAISRDD